MKMSKVSGVPEALAEKHDQYHETPTGKKFVEYFANWTIYAREFPPSKVPVDYIPELAYAFFDVKQNGDITSGDAYADFEKRFVSSPEGVEPLDDWVTEEPFYGCFGQFLKLKKQGKKFNLTLSLGGWTWSKYFSSAVLPENRVNFINNIMDLFNKYPIFCGVSLDWEYITSDGINHGKTGNESRVEDADNFRIFVQLLRKRLDADGKSHYKISVCCSANPSMAANMKSRELHPYVDELHIMSYDMSDGNWGDKTTAHHTNLKETSYCPFSVEEAVDAYMGEGFPPNKIMIGVAFYSRGFSDTEGPGKEASGGSPDQSWEKGIVDYKDLPNPGAVEYWDPNCKGAFSYDASQNIYNSYDNVNSVYEKCKYIWDKNLKGCLVWEASGDHPISQPRSLTRALHKYLIEGDPRQMQPPPLPPVLGKTPLKPPSQEPKPPSQEPKPPSSSQDWITGTAYSTGSVVRYKEQYYECIQGHTSQPGWEPEATKQILWKITSPPPKPTPPPSQDPKPAPDDKECICKCCTRKIKSIRLNGNLDFSNIDIVYEE